MPTILFSLGSGHTLYKLQELFDLCSRDATFGPSVIEFLLQLIGDSKLLSALLLVKESLRKNPFRLVDDRIHGPNRRPTVTLPLLQAQRTSSDLFQFITALQHLLNEDSKQGLIVLQRPTDYRYAGGKTLLRTRETTV